MKVSEIAEQYKTTNEIILKTLKSLRLKAVDGNQDLSPAVMSVLKSELSKLKVKAPASPSKKEESAKEAKKIPAKKTKKAAEKEAKPSKTTKKADEVKAKEVKPKEVKVKEKAPEVKEEIKKAPAPPPPPPKEKAPIVEPPRLKTKISREPIITLKPLARKRKKGGPEQRTGGFGYSQGASTTSSTGLPLGTTQTSDQLAATGALGEEKITREIVLQDLEVDVPISVKNLSLKLQQKPAAILKELMKMGIFAHINQGLDEEIVSKILKDFGFNLAKVKTQEEQLIQDHKKEDEDPKLLKQRPPVVTFMGHVDHGKTSLLDRIRKSKVADSEHGGITQHIGAYSVNIPKGRITFLDTPGHEAFTAMRARGAHITDLVVLVVAADEGVMPQTKEAIDHAHAADVPIIVALNKIDKRNAQPDVIKKQLMEIGLNPEDWGGKTVVAGVSATTGEGIDNLLEMILLEAELLELKANYEKKASGIIVDANLSGGRGVVATLIVQSGTLKEGDYITVGPRYGKVKAMFDDHHRAIKEATPSTPIEILGLPEVPIAGESFYVVENEQRAREITRKREEQLKNQKLQAGSKITLEDLYAQIQKGALKELRVILKADVQGSMEALKDSLEKIPNDKVKLRFIHSGVGDVNASDVLLASASTAIIIAFHVDIDVRAKQELEKQPVDIRKYRIIYDAVNDMHNALEGLLEAKTKKKYISRVEIREVFKLTKGIIAGCYVTKGRVQRKANIDVVRNEEIVYSGTINSLKRFKDDVKDVMEGMECGITLSGFDKIQPGDIIEVYEIESIAQKL